MIHVTLPQLCAYLDGELAEASAELVRRHLSICLECTERFAGLEAQDEILIRVLTDNPEDEFFQSLSASIPLGEPTSAERPAPPERPKPARARPGRRAEDQSRSRFGSRAALIAAAVCCVLAGSAAWVAFRPKETAPVERPTVAAPAPVEQRTAAPEPEPPAEAGPGVERTAEPIEEYAPTQVAEPSAEPPTPQATDETAADLPGSATDPEEAISTVPATEVMAAMPVAARAPEVARKQAPAKPKPAAVALPNSAPAKPAPAAELLVERTPRNVVPVRTLITETIVESPAQSAPPEAAAPESPRQSTTPDPVAAALRDAKSASLEAAKSRLPASFDKSAEAWQRALPLLANAPEELAAGRRELAQSRFQAWAAEPTPARREAAIASARQYLLYAPPGPERDQAWTWLGRLKH